MRVEGDWLFVDRETFGRFRLDPRWIEQNTHPTDDGYAIYVPAFRELTDRIVEAFVAEAMTNDEGQG